MKLGAIIAIASSTTRIVGGECYPGIYSDESYEDCYENNNYDSEIIETTVRKYNLHFTSSKICFGVSSNLTQYFLAFARAIGIKQ